MWRWLGCDEAKKIRDECDQNAINTCIKLGKKSTI